MNPIDPIGSTEQPPTETGATAKPLPGAPPSPRLADEDNNKDRPPLENEYLKQLLDFVAQRASEELQRGAAMKGALITASLSLIASLTSVGVALMSVH